MLTAACLPGGATWAPMCAHPSWAALYGGLLARCEGCGLVVTATTPEFDYAQEYFTGGGSGGYDFDSGFAKAFDEVRFAQELTWLERQGLRGALLDIGCATGTYLEMAVKRGWQVSGVEVAEFARGVAAQRTGARIVGSLDDLPSGQAWDVVTLHHVLEHIHEPVGFLRDAVRPRVARRLVIEVPNFASLHARAAGPGWRDLRPEQHVCHYEPDSLAKLLTAAGYEVVRVYTRWQPLWSLHAARELLSTLPALVATSRPARAAVSRRSGSAAPAPAYVAPRGARRILVEGSRLAALPLIRLLERRGFGERLVIEAAPSAGAR